MLNRIVCRMCRGSIKYFEQNNKGPFKICDRIAVLDFSSKHIRKFTLVYMQKLPNTLKKLKNASAIKKIKTHLVIMYLSRTGFRFYI